MGVCYRFEKKYIQAEKHLRRAIKIDPNYGIAYAELGHVKIRRKIYGQARRVLRKSTRLDPDYYWARLYLAVANWFLRRLKEAQDQYLEALRIEPRNSISNSFYGDFLSSERKEKAEYYLKKGIQLNPKDEIAHYHMGKHLYRRNRYCEAKPYLKKAAQLGEDRAKELLVKISEKVGELTRPL